MNSDISSMLRMAVNFTLTNQYTCECKLSSNFNKMAYPALTSNTALLEQLRAEEFDVGIAEPMTLCGFGK